MTDSRDRLLYSASQFFKIIAKREPTADELADLYAVIADYLYDDGLDGFCCKKAMKGFGCFCAATRRERER